MAQATPHNGISARYVALLKQLDDTGLYSASRIAALSADRKADPKAYRRIRKAMTAIARRHGFAEGGDDMILWQGRTMPAWFGSTWKAVVAKQTQSEAKRQSRPRMKYQHLILRLHPYRLYSPQNIVHEAMAHDQLPATDKQLVRACNALFNYRKRRIKVAPDGHIPIIRNPSTNSQAWYGWRWLLALPEGCLSVAYKTQLMVDIQQRNPCQHLDTFTNKALGTIFEGMAATQPQIDILADEANMASGWDMPQAHLKPVIWTDDTTMSSHEENEKRPNHAGRETNGQSAEMSPHATHENIAPTIAADAITRTNDPTWRRNETAALQSKHAVQDNDRHRETGALTKLARDQRLPSHQLPRIRQFAAGLAIAASVLFTVFWLVGARHQDALSVNQIVERPDPEGLEHLLHLWQQEDNSMQRAYIATGLNQAARRLPTATTVATLRQMANHGGDHRAAAVGSIADVQRQMKRIPVALDAPVRPLLVATFRKNPALVVDDQLLQPGDWVSIDHRVGYIDTIQRHRLLVKFEDQIEPFAYTTPQVLGVVPPKLGRLTCWDGQMNLHQVLCAVAQLQGKQFIAGNHRNGHVGGTFLVDDWDQFLDYLQSTFQLTVTADSIRLPASQAPQIAVNTYFSIPKSLKKHLLDYAAQCGLSPDFHDLPSHFESAAVHVEGLQLQEILATQGDFFIRATPEKLVIQSERGLP